MMTLLNNEQKHISQPPTKSYGHTMSSPSRKRQSEDGNQEGEKPARKRISAENEGIKDEKENHDDGDSEDSDLIDEKEICWTTDRGEYTAKIDIRKNCDYEQIRSIRANLIFDGKSIGALFGTILPRPSSIFYEMADCISGELQWLSCLFCDANGAATRISTGLHAKDIYSGGFLHMTDISIDKAHKGQDLGLRLVHETLVFVRGQWNLVVLTAHPLTTSFEDRLGILEQKSDSNNDGEDLKAKKKEENNNKIQGAKMKICRHWARLGFQQAGRNVDECDAWYMTSLAYFGRHEESVSSKAMNNWKTGDQVKSLDIFVAPEKHVPMGVDKKLKDLVLQKMHKQLVEKELEIVLGIIEDLVQNQNASIHRSRLLFTLAANARSPTSITILRTLIKLSGNDSDAPNGNGNRPLHIAAGTMNPATVNILIQSGASRTLENVRGFTPLQNLEKTRQDSAACSFDFVRPIDVNPFVGTVFCLMTNDVRSKLVDGWLSPRMMHMLTITAEFTWDALQSDDGSTVKFEESKPAPLSECCGAFGVERIDYIPTEVLRQNPEGLHKSFVDGWAIVWEAIMKLLKVKRVPTKTMVKHAIYRMGADTSKWDHFVEKGGKIEYALDALISVTRNVLVDGDDGWEYEMFEDDINEHPATPVDGAFDVTRVKCLEITDTNFMQQPRGPYNHDFGGGGGGGSSGGYQRRAISSTNSECVVS